MLILNFKTVVAMTNRGHHLKYKQALTKKDWSLLAKFLPTLVFPCSSTFSEKTYKKNRKRAITQRKNTFSTI